MLVHKITLGVLETAPWDGSFRTFNGIKVPVIKKASISGLGLDPDEWWEIDDKSAVARIIHSCWPWFDPIIESGELIGASKWPDWKVYDEPEVSEVLPVVKSKRKRRRTLTVSI